MHGHLGSASAPAQSSPQIGVAGTLAPEEIDEGGQPTPLLPFKDTLFG
jgi:hypothetical protein